MTEAASPRRKRPVWEDLERALAVIEERPRLAAGMESVEQTTRAGERYVVVHSTQGNSYLKLDPEEFELLPYMDGSRSIKDLVVLYYQLHEVLALGEVTDLVALLRSHGFLTEPAFDAYAELESKLSPVAVNFRPARMAVLLLKASIPLPGFDSAVGRLYRAGGWVFFTRAATVLGTALAVISFVLFIYELVHAGYPLFKFQGSYVAGVALLAVLDLSTISLHELGHALAMKHAGRRIMRSGLMLYYGAPCAYVDTTDVWMAPRGKRLIVSLAGPFTGVWIAGACTLAVLVLPHGPLAAFFFSWAFVALVDNLFNFCPFLELDGYYLLVDLLEKPMLRARSFAFIRGPLWQKLLGRERLTDEEKLFAGFGTASLAWSLVEIYLALKIWELRGANVIREVWATGQPLARAALTVVLAVIAIPVALAIRALVGAGWHEAVVGLRWAWSGAERRLHREAMAAVAAVPLWAELPPAHLLEIARAMRPQAVAEGAEVVRQGEPGDCFYVIADGAFEVVVDGSTVGRLGPGEYFGERALLRDAPRAATVVAVRPSRVFSIDRAAFRAYLGHDLALRERLEAALAYRDEVARMPLFRRLPPADLDLLLARLEPASIEAGRRLMREGEPGDRFYVIRSGEMRVLRGGMELARLGAGDAVGEIALLLDIPRTATVEAVTRSELLALHRADFRDLLTRYCHRGTRLERLSRHRLVAHRRSNREVAPAGSWAKPPHKLRRL